MKRIKKVSQTVPTTAQVVDGHSESTTDSYSCNYVNGLSEINAITVTLANNTTLPSVSQWTQQTIPFDTIVSKIGNKLIFANNKITIGAGVNHIKVSGMLFTTFYNNSTDPTICESYLVIRKNDVNMANTYSYDKRHDLATNSIILAVQENDEIKMTTGCNITASQEIRAESTFFTVEVVD